MHTCPLPLSAPQQHLSPLSAHMSPPPWTSLPSPLHPTSPGRYRALDWALCVSSFPLAIYITYDLHTCVSVLLSQPFPFLSASHCSAMSECAVPSREEEACLASGPLCLGGSEPVRKMSQGVTGGAPDFLHYSLPKKSRLQWSPHKPKNLVLDKSGPPLPTGYNHHIERLLKKLKMNPKIIACW